MNHHSIELDWLKRWDQYSPNKTALIDAKSGLSWNYSELYRASLSLSFELKAKFNIQKGDRIAVLSENNFHFVPLFFAISRLGGILVPINFRLKVPEINHILRDSRPKVLLYSEQFKENALDPSTQAYVENRFCVNGENQNIKSLCRIDVSPEVTPFEAKFEDPAMILYTSGTTGFPKGATLTHKMIFWNSINTTLRLQLSANDTQVCFLPFFHTGGWNVLLLPTLHQGGTNVIVEKFDPSLILKLSERYKATILFGVPTTMDMMAQTPEFTSCDLSGVRYGIVGGEPMPVSLIQTWAKKNIPIRQGYGLTEFGPNVFSLNEEDAIRKIGSIGFPNFYVDVKVINKKGTECKVDEIGELLLKGPMCMQGYWNNSAATADTIKDGWLHTGDLVKFDSEGYYYIVGRKKEMFISGGENVYPVEVEQVISQHDAIHEVAVVGVPDDRWGEVGRAFVSLKPGKLLDRDQLSQFCESKMAKFKIPKYLSFLDELPKGDSGKLLKKDLPRQPEH